MSIGTSLTSQRLEQWRAVQPQGWRGVWVPVALWLVLFVTATALSPEGGCTVAAPCGPDWWSAFEVAIALAAPVMLLWRHAAGTVVSLLAGATFMKLELDFGALPLWLSVGLPALIALATLDAEGRRRRRAVEGRRLADGLPRQPFPGSVPEPRTWTIASVVAVTALASAGVLLGYGVVHGDRVADEEARAPHVVGSVVAHGDDGYLITVEVDGARHEIDTLFAADYPVSSEQELLVRGEGEFTLAAERYDPAGWLFGVVFLALFGLGLLGPARHQRAGARELLSSPVPVHRVRVGWSEGKAQILPLDDDRAAPLLSVPLMLLDDAPDEAAEEPEIETADLYGAPLVGSQCALVLDSGARLLPLGPAKKGDPHWRDHVVDFDADSDARSEAEVPDSGRARATDDEVAQWRAQLIRPQWWRVPLGALLILGTLVAGFFVARTSEGVLTTLWRCAIAGMFAFDGLVYCAARVRLTEIALVYEGPTTRRTFPWNALTGVTAVDDVVLARLECEAIPLPWLPHRPWFGRNQRRREWARQWAEVLASEIGRAAPEPRRTLLVEPRLPAAGVALAFTASVLLGLWSRGAM